MSFLLVIDKTSSAPDYRQRLQGLLCPYHGSVEKRTFKNGALYLSSGGSFHGSHALFPAGTTQSSITAWLRIDLGDEVLRIGNDPMGMYPLWFFETEACSYFTSELKALSVIDGFRYRFKADEDVLAIKRRPRDFSFLEDVRNLATSAVTVDLRTREVTVARAPYLEFDQKVSITPEAAMAKLRKELEASLATSEGLPGPWGSMLSGGIDSSVATALLASREKKFDVYTLGTPLGDEYADAQDLAAHLGLRANRIFVSEDEAPGLFETVVWQNEVFDGLTAEILAQLKGLVKVSGTSSRRLFTGYGSDLLFGGMLLHTEYMRAVGVTNEQELIERTSWSGEFRPFFHLSSGVELYHLYWHRPLVQLALNLPTPLNFKGEVQKILLRDLAVEAGWLKREHAFRAKIGMSNGTNFYTLLSRALGLGDGYAYPAKTARAWEYLKRRLTELTGRAP